MSVKSPDGTWSAPAFLRLTGGSIGLQAGVQSADVVMVFRNDRSLDSIVNGKLTLGADVGVAAGPLGRHAATATDGQLQAEIWSWSRARGLFAGIALDGAVLSIDDEANQAVYGQGTTTTGLRPPPDGTALTSLDPPADPALSLVARSYSLSESWTVRRQSATTPTRSAAQRIPQGAPDFSRPVKSA